MTETHTPQDGPSGPEETTHATHGTGQPRHPGVDTEHLRDYAALRRSRTDRKIAGVAGGLGRHLNVDPTVLRVAFVVLCFFGGAGLILYAAAWLLVPEEQTEEAVVHTAPATRNTLLILAAVVAGVVVLGDSWGNWGGGFGGPFFPWPIALVGLVVLVVLLSRDRSAAGPHGTGGTAPGGSGWTGPGGTGGTGGTGWVGPTGPTAPTVPAGAGAPHEPGAAAGAAPEAPATAAYSPPEAPTFASGTYAAPPAPAAPTAPGGYGSAGGAAVPGGYGAPGWPPVPRPDRGPLLFGFTVALVAVALGVLGLYQAAGNDVASSAYPALALAIVGTMLVVGSVFGRAGGLILLGVVAAVALAVTSVTSRWDVDTPQDLRRTPTTSAQVQDRYSLFAGSIELDLSQVADRENLDGRTVQVAVEAGNIVVTVPDGVDVAVDATIDVGGEVSVAGQRDQGPSPEIVTLIDGGTDVPTLTLEVDASVGSIEVRQLQGAFTS